MEITEIIRDAFIFPSKNLETLSIYAVLSFLSAGFAIEGIVTFIFGLFDVWYFVIGAISVIISFIIGLLIRRISIQCIKSGIELEEKLPDFIWWKSFGTGFSKVIITIFYFIVPALLVVAVGFITNIYGNILYFCDEMVLLSPKIIAGGIGVEDAIYHAAFPLIISLAVTISAALIIFLIFSFFQAMAEARLAHKGSLKRALNIFGAVKDLTRIGVVKVIILSILIFLIVVFIEAILTVIFDHLLVLSILNIVTTPYLALFGQRALGLLYSDIV